MLVLAMLLFFGRLGFWQLERAQSKDQRLADFSAASQLAYLPDESESREFTRLVLKGRFRQGNDTLADNQVLTGQSGVHVYSAFELVNGQNILVNRGWLAMRQDRRNLPAVETPDEELEISGRIGPIPVPGRRLGSEGEMLSHQWPQLVTYPELDKITTALGIELYPWVLFLNENSPGGFAGRQWKPVFMSPERHRAYAFQWFALAATALTGWIFLTMRKGVSQ